MSPPSDRRRAARVHAAIAVELRDKHGFSFHSSRDISSGGAFFDRSIPHPVGSKVTVTFTLPGEKDAIVCEGEVVNVPDKKSFGMGVRFLNVKDADQQRLESFTQDQGKAS